jgi:hypothetical protein
MEHAKFIKKVLKVFQLQMLQQALTVTTGRAP